MNLMPKQLQNNFRVIIAPLLALFFLCVSVPSFCQENTNTPPKNPNTPANAEAIKDNSDVLGDLNAPLYTPFIERYMLDELKSLRVDLSAQRSELIQQLVDREIEAVDRSVSYATNTITYFFYLIAGVSSILVLVGWSSIRDIKERVHTLADEQITTLVNEYEQRLIAIEQQLNYKTQHIEENREEIELAREIHALWLRAAQDNNPQTKIAIYDQILALRPEDIEALTYKADAVLELGEPQWAVNLCHKALTLDPHYIHGLYQMACAYAALNRHDDALNYLSQVVAQSESYYDELHNDPALHSLRENTAFNNLLRENTPDEK